MAAGGVGMPAGAPTLLGDIACRVPRVTRRMTTVHGDLVLRTRGRVFGSWFGAPILVLETGGRRRRVTPTIATGGEHERLWQRMCAVAPVEHYQRRAGRELPVVILAAGAPVVDSPRPARLRPVFAT